MKSIYFILFIGVFVLSSCYNKRSGHGHGHPHGASSGADQHDDHAHDEVKNSYTVFSEDFEMFGEADPFVKGKNSEVLAHFTQLSDFKPLDGASVTLKMVIGKTGIKQTLEKPLRKGIYKFKIRPEVDGPAYLLFEINKNGQLYKIKVDGIKVYADEHDAIHEAELANVEGANDIAFLKEQVWNTDFRVEKITKRDFNEIINTAGEIVPSNTNEIEIVAQTSGVISLNDNFVQGKRINSGEILVSVSGGMLEDSYNVKVLKLKADLDKAKKNFDRVEELNRDNIVSTREYEAAKNDYEKVQAVYDNLTKNYSERGKGIVSPAKGIITEILVKEGQYVESGQIIAKMQVGKTVMLRVNLPKKYANRLDEIQSANFVTDYDKEILSTEALGGVKMNTGVAAFYDSPYIPIYFKLPASKDLITYSYCKVYLKAKKADKLFFIPNSALIESENVYWVYVQLAGETYIKREVELGVTDGNYWTVTKGLNEGDYVVTRGAFSVKQASMSDAVPAHTH
jgi:RND family efflux transporter MFP subunit